MRLVFILMIVLSAGILVWPAGAPAAAELNGLQIMERNFYATKLSSMQNEHKMILINDKGQERIRKLTGVSKLQSNGIDSNLMIRFQYPGDIRGTGFLQLQHQQGEDDL